MSDKKKTQPTKLVVKQPSFKPATVPPPKGKRMAQDSINTIVSIKK